jgi:hypothetical protein
MALTHRRANSPETCPKATPLRALALALILTTTPALGQDGSETHVWDISLLGLRAATFAFDATASGPAYQVEGRMKASGGAALVKRLRFEGRAEGRLAKGLPAPARYRESVDTGTRQSDATLVWQGGVPAIESYASDQPADPAAPDPATQKGTVDPLTAAWTILRDTTPERACAVALQVFDGRRRTAVRLSDPQPAGDGIACKGEYRRLAGFTEKELAQGDRFPFTLTFAPTPEGRLRAVEARGKSALGTVVLRRR